jgi:outer membrane protein OmpA-like peptidoglycan-associated protein
VPVVASHTPFYINNGLAKRLLLELEEGMMPTLRYADWADGSDEVTVRISAINFAPAWQAFQECEQGLLNFDFGDVRKSVFQYKVNQTALDAAARARLDQIARFFKLDPTIREIRVDGYTDSKGLSRINLVVARKRALAVKNYLVRQGVPAGKITLKAHHEKDGKFSNRTQAGRNRNRRVEVSLLR